MKSPLVALALVAGLSACAGESAQQGPDPGSDPGAESPDAPRQRKRGKPNRDGWAGGVEGMWVRPRTAEDTLTAEQRAEIERLEAIGYAGGYETAPALSGVTIHDRERADAGMNLVTSGHAPEALLLDMDGRVHYTWRYEYADVRGGLPPEDIGRPNTFRRVRLLADGELLAIYEGLGLVKLDRDSNLLWYFRGQAHHDLDVLPSGEIWVLTRKAAVLPDLHKRKPILEDFLTVLSPSGEELSRLSLIECFANSEFAHVLTERKARAGDIFHTNTLEILDGTSASELPAFRRGNVLISMRHNDTLAVVDPTARKVVWIAQGPWRTQHEPTLLANGNLLLFDNRGHQGFSQILELDPVSLAEVWAYRGTPPERFYSIYCGANQRLANGNTLISETCNGRAFEVTAAGEVVWEWINPHRAGDDGELIAAVFEVQRLAETPAWLESR